MSFILGICLLALALWCSYGWQPKIDNRMRNGSSEFSKDSEDVLRQLVQAAAVLIGVMAIAYGFICSGHGCR